MAAFDGGRITSGAGALLLREMAALLRSFERMSAAIPDSRDPDPVEHGQRHLLWPSGCSASPAGGRT